MEAAFFNLSLVYKSSLFIKEVAREAYRVDRCWFISRDAGKKECVCGYIDRVLTQDSVERVPHVDRVELGGREGTAHRSVSYEKTHGVRNSGFVLF